MTDLLKAVDNWFLILAVLLLGGYFLWSVQRMFNNLLESINELKTLIKDLFEHRNNHETRLTALETRCDIMHGDDPRDPGRRYYDPSNGKERCQ
jgi:uncharacterized protein Yka (UPF0111/DUF47 family)